MVPAGVRRCARAFAAGVTAAALAAGCGDGEDGQRDPAAAVQALQSALAAGDLEGACQLLTADARRHVGDAAHEPPTTCERDLVLIYEGLKKGGGVRVATRQRVLRTSIDGDRAEATVEAGDEGPITVPLAKEDGEWKVDALYGDIPGGDQEDNFQ